MCQFASLFCEINQIVCHFLFISRPSDTVCCLANKTGRGKIYDSLTACFVGQFSLLWHAR